MGDLKAENYTSWEILEGRLFLKTQLPKEGRKEREFGLTH